MIILSREGWVVSESNEFMERYIKESRWSNEVYSAGLYELTDAEIDALHIVAFLDSEGVMNVWHRIAD